MAQVIDGRHIAHQLQQNIAQKIKNYHTQGHRAPALAVILVGDDPASHIYVKRKHHACHEVGITTISQTLPANTSQSDLLQLISQFNEDPNIDGILVQVPLPAHIDTHLIYEAIHINKDVDGFHPYNIGRLVAKKPNFRPCTPRGIMTLLRHIPVDLKGLHAVVVGVSYIVGRPMILELLMAGATVTACHRLTKDLSAIVKTADVLVVATGNPNLILGDWVKKGAIVIDVGMNRLSDGRLVGDVEFEEALKNAAYITPVPGGVGPMTVATLLYNTVMAYEKTYLYKQGIIK